MTAVSVAMWGVDGDLQTLLTSASTLASRSVFVFAYDVGELGKEKNNFMIKEFICHNTRLISISFNLLSYTLCLPRDVFADWVRPMANHVQDFAPLRLRSGSSHDAGIQQTPALNIHYQRFFPLFVRPRKLFHTHHDAGINHQSR